MPFGDFSSIRREIKEAARRAFSQVRAEHPDETFYAFALYTDDDATGICPAANTEEAYQRCLDRYRADESFLQFLKEHDLEFSPFDYRWGTPEWAYEHDGSQHFNALCERLGGENLYDDSDPDGFVNFRGTMFATMLQALKDLDEEGYFGVGPERERITLFCSVSDSASAAWLEEESARRLNPPTVYQTFFEQWKTNSVMAEGLAEHQREPDEAYQAFRQQLESP